MTTRSTLTHLECGRCGATYPANQLMNLCPDCSKPLLARYDLQKAAQTLTKEALKTRAASLWRYEEVLPVQPENAMIDLGEGWMPLHLAARLGEKIGCNNSWIKDESMNQPATFKAQCLCVSIIGYDEVGEK